VVLRPSLAGRPSLSGNRRSSAHSKHSFSGSSSSSSTSIRSDPRPLTDKSYQRELSKKIIIFLTAHKFPHPISQKILASPSSRDFKLILHFLFSFIDGNFNWKNEKEYE